MRSCSTARRLPCSSSHQEFPTNSGTAVDWLARWSQAVPEVRRWVDDNREAMAVYRQGTERPDALDLAIGFDRGSFKTIGALWSLYLIVLFEASRLEEQGEMAGAWGWYRAILRTSHHIGMHSGFERRNMILRWHRELHNRLTTWADDPKTTSTLLRRALDDVVACEALAPSERDSIMAGLSRCNLAARQPDKPGARRANHAVPPVLASGVPAQSGASPGDLGYVAILAPRTRKEPTSDSTDHGQLAGVS